MIFFTGCNAEYNNHEESDVHYMGVRIPIPVPQCDGYDNVKDCIRQCNCRWCYNTTKCSDKFELGHCPLHTDEPDWCLKSSDVGEIIVFVILGPTACCLFMVIVFATIKGIAKVTKWFRSKTSVHTVKPAKRESYVGQPLNEIAKQHATYGSV